MRQLPAGRHRRYERELVRKILSGIARAGERYGRHRIVAMLTGDTGDLPPALTRLSTTGLLRHETPDALHGWIDASISAGLVVVSNDQYRTLSLTEQGRETMRGCMQDLQIRRPSRSSRFSALRRYRADRPHSWRAFRNGASRVSRRVVFETDRVHTRKVDGCDD